MPESVPAGDAVRSGALAAALGSEAAATCPEGSMIWTYWPASPVSRTYSAASSTSWSASSTITFCAFRREAVSSEAVRRALQQRDPDDATEQQGNGNDGDGSRRRALAQAPAGPAAGPAGRTGGRGLVHASRMRHPRSTDNRRRRLSGARFSACLLSVLSGALGHTWSKTKSRTDYRPHSLLNQCAAGHFVRFDAEGGRAGPPGAARQDSGIRTAASP